MALYLIGDVQGCDAALGRLLDELAFSPSRDRLWVLGDLVNRGPDSLAVLRRLMALDGAAQALLGNHDLHLLAVAEGLRQPHRLDTLDGILQLPARQRDGVLQWLCHRPLAGQERGVLMVHAGVLPDWTVQQTLALAQEVETVLRSPERRDFLCQMYGNEPAAWDDALAGVERWRVVVNALTRMRFCSARGRMEFASKEGAGTAPAGYFPWFDVPGRRSAQAVVAFGHWSTLGWLQRPDLIALDSGCVWGGQLTAVRLSEDGRAWERFQVSCPQSQVPGHQEG